MSLLPERWHFLQMRKQGRPPSMVPERTMVTQRNSKTTISGRETLRWRITGWQPILIKSPKRWRLLLLGQAQDSASPISLSLIEHSKKLHAPLSTLWNCLVWMLDGKDHAGLLAGGDQCPCSPAGIEWRYITAVKITSFIAVDLNEI